RNREARRADNRSPAGGEVVAETPSARRSGRRDRTDSTDQEGRSPGKEPIASSVRVPVLTGLRALACSLPPFQPPPSATVFFQAIRSASPTHTSSRIPPAMHSARASAWPERAVVSPANEKYARP